MSQQLRSRRSNLAVPGSSPKMLDKARGLAADQVFMDIEDAVAPIAKPEARTNIVAALNEGGYEGKVRVVRVNDWTTHWTYADVIEVVEGAGQNLDCIMLPKVQTPEQIVALDLLLTQIEKANGFEVGRIGIEAQIENALGLLNVVVVVSRDGGSQRLSAGDLSRGYTEAARAVLAAATAVAVVPTTPLELAYDYADSGPVQGVLSAFRAEHVDGEYGEAVRLVVRIESGRIDAFTDAIRDATAGAARVSRSAPRAG